MCKRKVDGKIFRLKEVRSNQEGCYKRACLENKVLKQLKNAQSVHFVEQIAFFKDKRK